MQQRIGESLQISCVNDCFDKMETNLYKLRVSGT